MCGEMVLKHKCLGEVKTSLRIVEENRGELSQVPVKLQFLSP